MLNKLLSPFDTNDYDYKHRFLLVLDTVNRISLQYFDSYIVLSIIAILAPWEHWTFHSYFHFVFNYLNT